MIRSRKPDVVYVPGYYSQAGEIVKQARQLGMLQPFLGGDGWDSPRLFAIGGEALNGSHRAAEPRLMLAVEPRKEICIAPS